LKVHPGAPFRRRSDVSSANSSFATNSSSNTSSSLQTDTSWSNPTSSQSYPPPTKIAIPNRNWQTSSVTDAPTPSLCSDNDVEREETSPDDQPPSTPPASIGPSRGFYRFKGNGIPVQPDGPSQDLDISMGESSRRSLPIPNPDYRDEIVPIHKSLDRSSNVFAKRPPSTPFPDKSPRRPRPPTRTSQTQIPSQRVPLPPTPPRRRDRSDEEEDPLSLTFSSPETGVSLAVVNKKKAKDGSKSSKQTNRKSAAAGPATVTAASSSRQSSQSQSQSRHRSTSQSSRRLTLDEEIRIATSSPLPDDEQQGYDDDDYESTTFTGVGTRSKRHGFLAHGGAGGLPVFMGVGYVDGAEEDYDDREDDEVETKMEQRRSASRARASAGSDLDEYMPSRMSKSTRGRRRS